MDYSGYHTVHNLEIPNLAITVSNCSDEILGRYSFVLGFYRSIPTDRKYTGGFTESNAINQIRFRIVFFLKFYLPKNRLRLDFVKFFSF